MVGLLFLLKKTLHVLWEQELIIESCEMCLEVLKLGPADYLTYCFPEISEHSCHIND